jgi:hypothetical protein
VGALAGSTYLFSAKKTGASPLDKGPIRTLEKEMAPTGIIYTVQSGEKIRGLWEFSRMGVPNLFGFVALHLKFDTLMP